MSNEQSDCPYKLNVEQIPSAIRSYAIEFSVDERKEIADRFNIPAIETLNATIEVSRKRDRISVSGSLEAILQRICVISLEMMDEAIREAIELDFIVLDSLEDEEEIDLDEESPEPLIDKKLDLKELIIQQLSLEMDDFPRKEGAELPEEKLTQKESSPFDILKQ